MPRDLPRVGTQANFQTLTARCTYCLIAGKHDYSPEIYQYVSRTGHTIFQANDLSKHFKAVHSQKRASCSKSAITQSISRCVRIACSGLMITSLLQVVNRLAASCKLHAGLMQVVSSTCSKSANIKLYQV